MLWHIKLDDPERFIFELIENGTKEKNKLIKKSNTISQKSGD